MARLNVQTTSSDPGSDEGSSSTRLSHRISSETSRSPALSYSSDKENRDYSTKPAHRGEKRKSETVKMATPSTSAADGSNKKRKTGDRGDVLPSQAAHRRELEERADKQFYDPDQDEEERRATRKGMRDLAKNLNGISSWSQPSCLYTDTSGRFTRGVLAGQLKRPCNNTEESGRIL